MPFLAFTCSGLILRGCNTLWSGGTTRGQRSPSRGSASTGLARLSRDARAPEPRAVAQLVRIGRRDGMPFLGSELLHSGALPERLTALLAVMNAPDPALIARLAAESREFDTTGKDPERNCWLAVHRHEHGVLPSEYDIRDVPEALYLAVLAERRAQDEGGSLLDAMR